MLDTLYNFNLPKLIVLEENRDQFLFNTCS